MKSSYKNNVNFGDIISAITSTKKPGLIVECGILNGYSLSKFIEHSNHSTTIHAYDIFEEFNGNHSNKENIINNFSQYKNVKIQYGNFFNVYENYKDKSIDLLHIDIANNGDIYDFVFQKYIKKLKDNGIIIMEGGSNTRDNIEWMVKYNKPKIEPVIQKYKNNFDITVIGDFPSITLITKK